MRTWEEQEAAAEAERITRRNMCALFAIGVFLGFCAGVFTGKFIL